jgi:hypothetical protein
MPGKKDTWSHLYHHATERYRAGLTYEKIQTELLGKCADEPMVFAVMKKVKSDNFARARKEGRVLLAAGFLFILAGFVITCFNFHANQSVAFAMYGLTTIGLAVVFYGLYKIIG